MPEEGSAAPPPSEAGATVTTDVAAPTIETCGADDAAASVVAVDGGAPAPVDGASAPADPVCRKLSRFDSCGPDDVPRDCAEETYDRDGNWLTRVGHDVECAGTLFLDCRTAIRDADGNIVAEAIDPLCDGVPDRCELSGSGQIDADCDGSPEENCSIRSGDACGSPQFRASDVDCDGVPDQQCAELECDGSGRELERRTDSDCDGSPDSFLAYTYDAAGNVTITETGYFGGYHYCEESIYDCRGNAIRGFGDEGCDGPPYDDCWESTFDDQGNPTTYSRDEDCDGTIGIEPAPGPGWDPCWTREYDAAGHLLVTQEDADCDGTADMQCEELEYDAGGNRIRRIVSENCDGVMKNCENVTYDLEGHELTSTMDRNCDGVLEDCRAYAYDLAGRVVRKEFDDPCDGVLEKCELTEWDGQRVTRSVTDDRCDGVADDCHTFTYEPCGPASSDAAAD